MWWSRISNNIKVRNSGKFTNVKENKATIDRLADLVKLSLTHTWLPVQKCFFLCGHNYSTRCHVSACWPLVDLRLVHVTRRPRLINKKAWSGTASWGDKVSSTKEGSKSVCVNAHARPCACTCTESSRLKEFTLQFTQCISQWPQCNESLILTFLFVCDVNVYVFPIGSIFPDMNYIPQNQSQISGTEHI